MITSQPAVCFSADIQAKKNLETLIGAGLLFSQSCSLDLTRPVPLINSKRHPA